MQMLRHSENLVHMMMEKNSAFKLERNTRKENRGSRQMPRSIPRA